MAKKISVHIKKGKPLKRHPALISLSRDHHFILLLCWKIRTGRHKKIEDQRISRYVQYFFKSFLIPHLRIEEECLFLLLSSTDPHRQEVLAHHDRLRELFNDLYLQAQNISHLLDAIEEELEAHIRYEERVLFPAIQEKVSEESLETFQQQVAHQPEIQKDSWEDLFWQ